MSERHVGARVSEQLADALEEAARESNTSKSELIRHYLTESILSENGEMVPEYLQQELRREQQKRRNRLEWQRVHFPSNVADKFKRAFEQGDLDGDLGEAAVDDLRDIYIEDARLLFEASEERREAAVEYVHAVADHAEEAADASEFDRLDPEEMFQKYGGVERGTQREGTDMQRVIRDAEERLDSHLADEDSVVTVLSKHHGISSDLARECVEYALGRSETVDGVEL